MYGVPIPLCQETNANINTKVNNIDDNNNNDNDDDNNDDDDTGYGNEFEELLATRKAEIANIDPNAIDI